MSDDKKPVVKLEPKHDSRPNATPAEVRVYLDETGTPSGTLELVDRFMAATPKGTGKDLYEWLVSLEQKQLFGTIRKTCKFLFGPSAEPKQVKEQGAVDQSEQYRAEAANLRYQLERANADKRLLENQVEYWKRKSKEMAQDMADARHKAGLPPMREEVLV